MRVLSSVFAALVLFSSPSGAAEKPEFISPSLSYAQSTGAKFRFALPALLKKPDPRIKFRVSPLPDWMVYDFNQQAYVGTTPREAVKVRFRVEAALGSETAIADVLYHISQNPTWVTDRLDLGKFGAGDPLSYNVRSYVDDPDGRNPRLYAKGLPTWAKFDEKTGVLTGQPPANFTGNFSGITFTFRADNKDQTVPAFGQVVRTGRTGRDEVTLVPREVQGQKPPVTRSPSTRTPTKVARTAVPLNAIEDKLEFTDLVVGKPFGFDIRSNIDYAGTDPLSYSYLITPPAWMKLDKATGKISGTPPKVENFTAVVQVTDGTSSAQVSLQFSVQSNDLAPVIDEAALNFAVKERESKTLNLKDHVTDDSPSLNFKVTGGAGWVSLTQAGSLTLAPRYAQALIGTFRFPLEVSDGVHTSKATITVTVAEDPQAPVWNASVQVPAKVGTDLNHDISAAVRDLDGRPLKFTMAGGLPWLNIDSSKGVLFGRVPEPVGNVRFTVRASNNSKFTDKEIIVSVTRENRAPAWAAPSIELVKGRVGDKYSLALNDPKYVKEPDGEGITFEKVSGLAWVAVSEEGELTGTPKSNQQGEGSLLVKASDPSGASSQVTLSLFVLPPNAPPEWLTQQQPFFRLGEIPIGKALDIDLLPKVKDPDGDPVTFLKARGPSWINISQAGKLTGTPPAGEKLGDFTLVVQAKDAKLFTEAAFVGKVVPPNNPPVIDLSGLVLNLKERASYPLDLVAQGVVKDADKTDRLRFSLLTRADWISLTPEGLLTLRPTFAQIGTQSVKFSVSDGKDSVEAALDVNVARVPRPPVFTGQQEPAMLKTAAGLPIRGSLKKYVEDLDGLPLKFSKKSGPAWLTVDVDGNLGGTPTESDAGTNSFIVVAENDKLPASGALLIEVTSDNSPPAWTAPLVTLPNAKAEILYYQSLKKFAPDPDGDQVTFAVNVENGKRQAPDWVEVVSGGLAIGTPPESVVGLNVMTVRATDSNGASKTARVQIQVVSKNNPPVWDNQTLNLGNAKVGEAFQFDVSRLAHDDDGDPLHFRKIVQDSPSWLLVADNGLVGGRPKETDSGAFTAVFEVSDTKAFALISVYGTVGGAAKPPVIRGQALSFGMIPGKTSEVNLNDRKYVEDPDDTTGASLRFTLLSQLPWVKLSSAGKLEFTPPQGLKDTQKVSFRVTGKLGGASEGLIQLTVVNSQIEEPKWLADFVEFTTVADSTFAETLNSRELVQDVGGLPLNFEKLSGPAWLTINKDGRLTGRPTIENTRGVQVFGVRASNTFKFADTQLRITVTSPRASLRYTFAEPEAEAPVDILFALDHTAGSAQYYADFKASSADFFRRLDGAKVRYSVAVMSTRSFVGSTIADAYGQARLTNGSSYIVQDFNSLVSATRTNEAFNSPIWALDHLFTNLKFNTRLYGQDFYLPEVPLMVYVHTNGRDKVELLARNSRLEGLRIEDYARRFNDFHAKLHKPFKIYVNDMSCDATAKSEYDTLALATGGFRVSTTPCGPTFLPGLETFADEVIEQSARSRKNKFGFREGELPRDPSKIKVTLKSAVTRQDYLLEGGRGEESDQWHYDPTEEAVVVHWWNIRVPYDSKRDSLEIDF